MNNCIFCKIINKEIPSFKIYEDDNFIAFLDINPPVKGMALVIPKKHFESNFLEVSDDILKEISAVSKKVSEMLVKAFEDVHRVAMVIEGMGVDHLHVKLYPMHGVEKEFKTIEAPERIFFENYPGYISTQLGPQIDLKDLEEIQKKILGK